MLNTVIEAIKRLENNENRSKSERELLEYLYAEADKEINANMLNLMTYGERLGWERIEERLTELLKFIHGVKG